MLEFHHQSLWIINIFMKFITFIFIKRKKININDWIWNIYKFKINKIKKMWVDIILLWLYYKIINALIEINIRKYLLEVLLVVAIYFIIIYENKV